MWKALRNIFLEEMSQTISSCYLGFCCWVGPDQVWALGEGHTQLWKQRNYIVWNKHILMHGSITSIMWASVLVLLKFVWNSPSVHTVRWFIDVLLEVMILTLSHFENQLHPSCHADASSHAVNPFFCTVRGSFGKRLKEPEQY